jgi:deoxyribodipyrimidine photolyase-related protein
MTGPQRMHELLLVFPHQLFAMPPDTGDCRSVLLVEEPLFFTQYAFHKQKLLLQRAGLRYYQSHLQQLGWQTRYIEFHDQRADVRQLLPALAAEGVQLLYVTDVDDDWLKRRLEQAAAGSGLALKWYPSPQFLTPTDALTTQFKSTRRKYLQNSFYIWQRKRLGLLLDHEGAALGGQWSFDADNRKPWPKRQLPPPLPRASATPWHAEAMQWVQQQFPTAPGSLEGALHYPVTHAQADAWLDDFLQQRFAGFGTWEDAIVGEAAVLQHSVLTPMLNNGLLLPETVLQKTLAFAAAQRVPLNDTEGFVRQLVGWREFIRGLYLHHGRQQRTANHWGFTQPLPRAFYDASTGIEPVDTVLRKVLRNGYCHHIERLMILGCFMLLCECHPHGVYQWFMELFVDAYDWVMVPNVYGMSQFADGGLMATKPYICGSNYILKMSDFRKGDWCHTWDALFWRFIHRHGPQLQRNPRLAMLVRNFAQRPAVERDALLQHADAWLLKLHAGSHPQPATPL